MEKLLIGSRHSSVQSSLHSFECLPPEKWVSIRQDCRIPFGFLFLAGIYKYYVKSKNGAKFKFEEDYLFVQSMLPHSFENNVEQRKFGCIYSLYEPTPRFEDDVVLEESAIYQLLPDNHIKLVLADGEHRNPYCVGKMFEMVCQDRNLQNFAKGSTLPGLYSVTFKKKSCGYFLKDYSYIVWAMPIGIPDQQRGSIDKGWIFCDINCGIPAIISCERETFEEIHIHEGARVGLFTIRNGELVFEKH